jgi:capsule polysaccharide export protein KpsE/RkpR
MAQAYVEELNRTLAAVSTSSARRERIFLEGRLQGVNRDLEASEKEFGQFASKNAAIDIKEQGKAMVTAAASLEGELIAARSELEGLRQIYTDGNVRVRSAQARISELQNQIEKVSGEYDSAPPEKPAEGGSQYPSIRELPLLGVPYADLYRKIRVQEALFEMLTQKYEMAKVEEAKEIPTVKALDLPRLPEQKSFPPRLVVILLGTILSFSFGVGWLSIRRKWEDTEPADAGKRLAREVFHTLKTAMPWAPRNGHELRPESPITEGPGGPPDEERQGPR